MKSIEQTSNFLKVDKNNNLTHIAQNDSFLDISTLDLKDKINQFLNSHAEIIPILNEESQVIHIVEKYKVKLPVVAKEINSKSPVKISFAGGGSDFTNFFSNHCDSKVLNTTINLFAHTKLIPRDDSIINIKIDKPERTYVFKDLEDLKKHFQQGLIKAILSVISPPFGFDLEISLDIPRESGLGGSSAVTSAILGAFNCVNENSWTKSDIVHLSFLIERIYFGVIGGWQDQVATTVGGFNKITFNKSSSFLVENLNSTKNDSLLNSRIYITFTNISRSSGDVLKQQDQRSSARFKNIEQSMSLVDKMIQSISQSNIQEFEILLNKSWEIKKSIMNDLNETTFNEIYDLAISKGATSGRLVGAGMGGHFVFLCSEKKSHSFVESMNEAGFSTRKVKIIDTGLESKISH